MSHKVPSAEVQYFIWEYRLLCEKHKMIIVDEEGVVEAEDWDIIDHIDKLMEIS